METSPDSQFYFERLATPRLDEILTGGVWYSDQEFDSELVEVLNQQCLKFLQQKTFKAIATHSDPSLQMSASLCTTINS